MAKKTSQISEVPAPAGGGDTRFREVVGLGLLLISLALCFALFSYVPDGDGRSNLVGPLGWTVAGDIFWAVGVVGYVAGVAAVLGAVVMLFGRVRFPSAAALFALTCVVLGAAILADLMGLEGAAAQYGGGGVLGGGAVKALRVHSGPAGAVLSGVGLVIMGLVTALRLSPRRWAKDSVDWVAGRVGEWWQQQKIRREAARAGRARSAQLQDGRNRGRVEAQRKKDARQAQYEERLRIAALKAEQEAEEKFRAKLEAEADAAPTAPAPAPFAPPPRSDGPAPAPGANGSLVASELASPSAASSDVEASYADADPLSTAPPPPADGSRAYPPFAWPAPPDDDRPREGRPTDPRRPDHAPPIVAPRRPAPAFDDPGRSFALSGSVIDADPMIESASNLEFDEPVELADAAEVIERIQRGEPLMDGLIPPSSDVYPAGEAWPLSERSAPPLQPTLEVLSDAELLPEAGVHGLEPGPRSDRGDRGARSEAETPLAAGSDLNPTPPMTAPTAPSSPAPEGAAKRLKRTKGASDLADELVIHERKEAGPDFADEGPSPPVDRTPTKPAYALPPINLLDYEGEGPAPINELALKKRATRLEEKLGTYGVEGKVVAIRPGPVVTTYEYQPAPGVKVAKIANLSDDIAMSMEAVRVRIVAPIPGRGVVGIELPNAKRENVYLKEIIAHEAFKHSKSLLTLALGKDAEGEPQVRDLRKMPHLMIAGTTGSGKSVSINTMVLSMLYKATPDQVKFIMVDPKMLELSLYNDIPHLLLPVVTDPKKASLALAWTVDEMERRYQLLSDAKVRDIQGFNKKVEKLRQQREAEGDGAGPDLEGATPTEEHPVGEHRVADPWRSKELPELMPFIVVLIDEFADLMMAAPRDVEASVQRLAQKARAAGIHVLLATQRPSTDVITGVIKNNFPSRLAFRVASRHDSATVLNTPGAENLLGMGDSLFLSVASPNPVRIHGAFVSEDEVERVVDFWKQQARPVYDETILKPKEDEDGGGFADEDVDELYDLAVRFVAETRKASISALQRKLRVGYNRAARMFDMMEAQGIVGPVQGPKGEREILVSPMGPDGPEPT